MRAPAQVAVFARAPRPGRAKTRLAPALGEEGASALYEAFLRDTLRTCRAAGLEVTVWCAEADDAPALHPLVGALPVRVQAPGDLGARMAAALGAHLGAGGPAMVVGTDVPTLPVRLLDAARDALGAAEVVLGPAADGGYYLVGARGAVPPIFEGVRWSTPHVLGDTLARARAAGIAPVLLPPWYDVDTPADLRLLRAHLGLAPGAAPATARRFGV